MIFTRAIFYLSTLIKKIKCFLWKRIPNRSKLPAIHGKKLPINLIVVAAWENNSFPSPINNTQLWSIDQQRSERISAYFWTSSLKNEYPKLYRNREIKNTRQHTNIDWKINQSPLEGLWCDPWPRRNASISDVALVKQLWSRAQHPKPRRNRTRCHFLLVLNKIEKKCNIFFLPFSIFQFVRNG